MDNETPPNDFTPAPVPAPKKRRRYSKAFKAQILTECDQPNASVAGVAVRHGLNPNMVQKWRLAGRRDGQSDFVRLPSPSAPVVAPAPRQDAATIRMEVPTPAGPVIVHWPLDALPHSVDWLRAVTR